MKYFHSAALIWLIACTPGHADITIFGPAAQTRIENIGALSQNQRAGLEDFAKSRPYFGAIFIERGGSGWGSYTGAHRLEDAFTFARRICDSYADAGECTLAGVLFPSDMDTKDIPQNTLSNRATEKFEIYMSRTEGYRAFAVSSSNAFGWATRQDTPSAAIETALSNCYASSMTYLLKLEVNLREDALEDGLFACRIIASGGGQTEPS